MKDKIYTRHHIIANAAWWTSNPSNIVLLRDSVHRWIHSVFWASTPVQQIRKLVELDRPVIKHHFYAELNRILNILEREEYCVYEPDCFNLEKFKDRNHD